MRAEPAIDEAGVRALVETQFPKYAGLPIKAIQSGGTDNHIFRLGHDLCVRLPKRAEAAGQIQKEQVWLPRLTPLPLKIPEPVAQGEPGPGFDLAWSIYSWLPGSPLQTTAPNDWTETARLLANFIRDLQAKPVAGGPLAGAQNHYRGVALEHRGALTRRAFQALQDEYSLAACEQVWAQARAAAPHAGAPVWLHGDLQGGNLLVDQGQLSAVIDFGLSGIGDPACDLMVAWSVLPGAVRAQFRTDIECDAATWTRGKGWAISVAAIALEYYRGKNPALSAISRQTLDAVLADD